MAGWSHCPPWVPRGWTRTPPPCTVSSGRAEVRWAQAGSGSRWTRSGTRPGWRGIRGVRAGSLDIGIDDLDPFRMPAVTGLAPRLGAREAARWARAIEQGWHLLAADHPAVATEVAAVISVIVPLSWSVHGPLSSSSPETFGAIAMSEPPDPSTCAVTFSHEVQHLKLCALLDIVSLTMPDDGRRYYAPWREDPRPVSGLLQGAYAYLGVTRFWRHAASAGRRSRSTAGGQQVRAVAGGHRAGHRHPAGQQAADGRGTGFRSGDVERRSPHGSAEPVSAQARAIALRESRHHLARWELNNGPVPA